MIDEPGAVGQQRVRARLFEEVIDELALIHGPEGDELTSVLRGADPLRHRAPRPARRPDLAARRAHIRLAQLDETARGGRRRGGEVRRHQLLGVQPIDQRHRAPDARRVRARRLGDLDDRRDAARVLHVEPDARQRRVVDHGAERLGERRHALSVLERAERAHVREREVRDGAVAVRAPDEARAEVGVVIEDRHAVGRGHRVELDAVDAEVVREADHLDAVLRGAAVVARTAAAAVRDHVEVVVRLRRRALLEREGGLPGEPPLAEPAREAEPREVARRGALGAERGCERGGLDEELHQPRAGRVRLAPVPLEHQPSAGVEAARARHRVDVRPREERHALPRRRHRHRVAEERAIRVARGDAHRALEQREPTRGHRRGAGQQAVVAELRERHVLRAAPEEQRDAERARDEALRRGEPPARLERGLFRTHSPPGSA